MSNKQQEKSTSVEKETVSTVESKTAKKNNSTSPKKSNVNYIKRNLLLLSMVATLFILMSLAMGIYNYSLWQKYLPMSVQTAKDQSLFTSQLSGLERQLQWMQSALTKETRARENAEAEHDALNTAMKTVSEKFGRTTLAWRMAEVEYLLTIANHRLALAEDKKTAIAVFETADSRLKAMGDPSLINVRQAISDELNALRSMADPDITSMALSIGSLITGIELLPLIDKERVAVAISTTKYKKYLRWDEIPQAIWDDIKSLVRVRRHQQPMEPLLPPQEAWFLQQNLRLKLEQARLSLLRRDTRQFRQYINEANAWIKSFFDTESSTVRNVSITLRALERENLQPVAPDVSGSLRLLRNQLLEQKQPSTNTYQSDDSKAYQRFKDPL